MWSYLFFAEQVYVVMWRKEFLLWKIQVKVNAWIICYWLFKCYHWFPLSKMLESDRMLIAASDRQRLLARTDIFVQTSEQFGHLEALGATMRTVAANLRARWPETEEMEYYPAFR